MKESVHIADVSVFQIIEFLDKVHGKQRLDSYRLKKFIRKTPEVHIERSYFNYDNGIEKIYTKYIFADNHISGGYIVLSTDEYENFEDLSDKFNEFMGVVPQKNSIQSEGMDVK